MLKIKLARFGKRNQPHFRVVVNEARDKRDGSYVDNIGHYAPTQSPKLLVIDLEAYDAWIKKGAQPTETVAALAERVRAGKPFEKKARLSKKAKAKQAEAAAASEAPAEEKAPAESEAPAAAEATAETPATE